MKALRALFGGALLMIASVSAHAYTECTGHVSRIFTDSAVYVWFDNGLYWQKTPFFVNSPPTPEELERQQSVKNLLAIVTTAMTTGRSVTVRFSDDGVSCTGTQTNLEVWGVYLNAT